jgi:hypothetical protein
MITLYLKKNWTKLDFQINFKVVTYFTCLFRLSLLSFNLTLFKNIYIQLDIILDLNKLNCEQN